MKHKFIEIRDEGTTIAALALQVIPADPVESAFMGRCGYPKDGSSIILMRFYDQRATNDPVEWGGRTMPVAHDYILKYWDTLKNGQVLDVQVILKETETPKTPEIFKP